MVEPGKMLVIYSAVITAAFVAMLLSGAASGKQRVAFDELDVQRINIREADGTLRMTISSKGKFPGLIVKGREYAHPTRETAGMLFFNDEGSETGGLIFGGAMEDGKPSSGGSLTFDRYEQDQVIQMMQMENGERRFAGLLVSDRPDAPLNFAGVEQAGRMPAGPEQDAAYRQANTGGSVRAFVGRNRDKSSEVNLRDGQGRKRLLLRVTEDGSAKIEFLDGTGKVVKTVGAE